MIKVLSSWLKKTKQLRQPGLLFSVEHLFLLLYIPIGLLFLFTIPLGQNPDEPDHTYRAWQLSTGNIISDPIKPDGKSRFGGLAPKSIESTFVDAHIDESLNGNFVWNNVHYSDQSRQALTDSTLTPRIFTGAAIYSPTAYVPSIIAFWIGSLLHLPTFMVLYLVRIFCLITIASMIYLAIRITPKWKWLFFASALMPSVVAAGGAISADAMVLGSAFLFIAYIISLSFQVKPLSIIQYVLLFIILSVVVLSKTPYSVLCVLILLIPIFNKQMRAYPALVKLGLIVIATAILGFLWMKSTQHLAWPEGLRQGNNPVVNRHIILHQPLSFLVIAINSAMYSGVISLTGLIGHFGWLTAPMSDIAMVPAIFALILSAFTGDKKDILPKQRHAFLWWNSTILCTIALLFLAITASLYIYWADTQGAVATGIQGRYLIPLLPLALLLIAPLGQLKEQRKTKQTLVTLLIISLLFGFATIYARYYMTIPNVL
ncbi:DUF2142 domain-containing protein [Candidatus Saccharibacteria bacterium]|jgi:predicted membrane protein|nr:DUF2142 domain-containing protein [Candidatus Saccharibacteria bacterium]